VIGYDSDGFGHDDNFMVRSVGATR